MKTEQFHLVMQNVEGKYDIFAPYGNYEKLYLVEFIDIDGKIVSLLFKFSEYQTRGLIWILNVYKNGRNYKSDKFTLKYYDEMNHVAEIIKKSNV